MLGESLHISSEYLAQEAKVEFALSRVVLLETENSKLKKELITVTGEANFAKAKAKTLSDDLRAERQLTVEKDEQLLVAKEKIKTIAIKAVKGFQQIVLFSWYFKGFELLRRYFIKHPSGVDLENLDLEEVDKEMATDEASNSSALDGDAPGSALPPPIGDDTAADA